MTTLDKIQLLMRNVKDEGVANSYRIVGGQFIHLHYGWKEQQVKTLTSEEDLIVILDILAQIYANEMRVKKKIVKDALDK